MKVWFRPSPGKFSGGVKDRSFGLESIFWRKHTLKNLEDFFFDLRLAIVFPPAIQAKKSGLDPLRKTRLAKARTATTDRAAKGGPNRCTAVL